MNIFLGDSSDEECSEKLELTKDNQTTDRIVIDRVPDEVTIKIFTYLNPQELGRCAQVSQHWNRLALDGSLWRNFLPVQWSKGAIKQIRFFTFYEIIYTCTVFLQGSFMVVRFTSIYAVST
jgi:hypothetical protein